MEALGLAVNAVLLTVNAFLFLAAYNKYTHALRLLDSAHKIAVRLLLKHRRSI